MNSETTWDVARPSPAMKSRGPERGELAQAERGADPWQRGGEVTAQRRERGGVGRPRASVDPAAAGRGRHRVRLDAVDRGPPPSRSGARPRARAAGSPCARRGRTGGSRQATPRRPQRRPRRRRKTRQIRVPCASRRGCRRPRGGRGPRRGQPGESTREDDGLPLATPRRSRIIVLRASARRSLSMCGPSAAGADVLLCVQHVWQGEAVP